MINIHKAEEAEEEKNSYFQQKNIHVNYNKCESFYTILSIKKANRLSKKLMTIT